MIVLKQQTRVSTENYPCQASPKSLLTPAAACDNTGHMSDPHRSFRENLASGRHTLTDMKTNSLTGLQNGTYVKHHLRVIPYAQHIFKYWHDNWAVGALWGISDWWQSPCCLSFFHHSGHEAPPRAHQEVRVYLLPFGAHLTMLEAVAPFALQGGTRKGHASQKSLPGNIMVTTAIILGKKKASSFLKTNTTKSILATHHVLLLKANYWCKPVLGISDTSWPTMQHPSPRKHCKQLFCHKEVTITLLTA